jgi:hypothetical protein
MTPATCEREYEGVMTDKDTLYHELVEVLQAGGCPLCRMGRRASDSYVGALLHEGVTDPDLREKLRAARGLCHRHAWRMARQRGSVLGSAIIYRDVVNTVIKALEAGEAAPSRWRTRSKQIISGGVAATAPCPACVLENDAVRRAAKTLLKHLERQEIAEGYLAAGGLCLPHFQEVVALASEGAARTLASWQATAYRRLRDNLDELIRKHDHRFAGEPISEAEADSWERAIAAVAGVGDGRTE